MRTLLIVLISAFIALLPSCQLSNQSLSQAMA